MYETFKEKEQFDILMAKLKSQNKEYIELEKKECIQKEKERIRIKYSFSHLDVGMAERHIKRKIAEKKIQKIERAKHYQKPVIEAVSIEPNYYSKERIAVYTVMFGGYDRIHEPVVIPDNVDFYIITDIKELHSQSVWKRFDDSKFKHYTDNLDIQIKNRWYKTHPHRLFSDYQYSLYVDSSIKIITDVTEHINNINQTGICFHRHPQRDCVYDELDVVRCFGRDSMENLSHTKRMYDAKNFPKHYGLLETAIIARKHNEKSIITMMEDWWGYIERYSRRDQLSLPVVLREHGIKVNDICGLGNNIKENYAFRLETHMGHYDRIKSRDGKQPR